MEVLMSYIVNDVTKMESLFIKV